MGADEKRKLVCMRAMQPYSLPRGTIFDRRCATCGERVAIALAGQAELREHPDTEICCEKCITFKDDDVVDFAAGAVDEFLRFLDDPNTEGNA